MVVGGLLLAGGASRRLGSDKARWRRGGETLAGRSARVLGAVAGLMLEVGPGVSGLDAVAEQPPGAGPLVATAAGWQALRATEPALDAVVVLAVDLPFVDAAVLRRLIEPLRPPAQARVPRIAGRAQPLCARYDAAALDVAVDLVGVGARAMHAWLDVIEVEYLDDDAWSDLGGAAVFADVDTVADATGAGLEKPR